MKTHPATIRGASAAACCASIAAFAPLAAQAQTDEPWQWEAAAYGWFPAIGGNTEFPSGASGPSFDVSASDVISSLKFAMMGSFGGKKGQWGFWTDLIYNDVGGSQSGSRSFTLGGQALPATLNGDLSLDMKSWIWTLAGTYELSKTPENTTDLLLGTRMVDITQTLSWSMNGSIAGTGLPAQSGSSEVTSTNWDAIVGVKGVAFLGAERRWVVPYYLDIGTGESKFTWQFNLGVGYRFDWGAAVLSWRYLDYQMKSGDPLQSMSFNGPLIGMAWQW